jgi:hypothetical protein
VDPGPGSPTSDVTRSNCDQFCGRIGGLRAVFATEYRCEMYKLFTGRFVLRAAFC